MFFKMRLVVGYYMNCFRCGLMAPYLMDMFEDMGF